MILSDADIDKLSIDEKRIGDIHVLLQDHAPKGARHAGFPVAWRPIKKDRSARIERRAELFKGGV